MDTMGFISPRMQSSPFPGWHAISWDRESQPTKTFIWLLASGVGETGTTQPIWLVVFKHFLDVYPACLGKSFPIWGLRMFLQMGWKKTPTSWNKWGIVIYFPYPYKPSFGLIYWVLRTLHLKRSQVMRCAKMPHADWSEVWVWGRCPEGGRTILGPKNRFIGKIFPPENEEKIWTILKGYMLVFGVGRTPLVGVVMPQIPQLILPLKIGQIGPKKEAGVQSSEPLLFRGFRHEFWREGNLDITLSLMAGWWFKYFVFLPLPGEMIQFDEHIFQMGWNHQPKNLLTTVQESYNTPRERVIACW